LSNYVSVIACALRLGFSGVFPLTLCAIQIYLLTYLLDNSLLWSLL